MLDCRYHGMCQLLSYDGNCTYVCPETGRCQICELMPDAKALLKLAEDIEKDVKTVEHYDLTLQTMAVAKYARRIREALGVSK